MGAQGGPSGPRLLLRRRHRCVASLWRAVINHWVKCAPELDQDLSPALGTDVFVSDGPTPDGRAVRLGGPIQQSVFSAGLALLLPSPPGGGSQNEEATLANDGTHPVSLTGWTLRPRRRELGARQPGHDGGR